MGVDFFPCANCGEVFTDCGEYYSCEYCDRYFCCEECADLKRIGNEEDYDYDDDENVNCLYCRKECADDSELLEFILKREKLTREQLFKMWKKDQVK